MTGPQPLTETDLDDINKALVSAEDAQRLIEQASQAGIDVAAFTERTRTARDKLLRIKQTFFPGK